MLIFINMEMTLEKLVKQAIEGDKQALEQVIINIKDFIYNLSVRVLWHPADAQDATQEILIKVITNLGSFKHNSAFKTWCYRIATNYLLSFKQKRFKHQVSFEEFGQQLNQNFSNSISYTQNNAEQNLLIQEAKVGCSNAMLQCLNKESRIVYILAEILEFNGNEGAELLGITPASFRKKLSRARTRLHQFINGNCGIINPANSCRCYKKVDNSIKQGKIDPKQLLFITNQKSTELINAISTLEDEVTLFQSNPTYTTPLMLINDLKKLINTHPNL